MRYLTLIFLCLMIGLSLSVSIEIKFFYISGLGGNEDVNETLDKVSQQYLGLIDIERIPFQIKTFGGFYDKNPKAIAYDVHKTPAIVINDQLIFEGYRVEHEELIVKAIDDLLMEYRVKIQQFLDEVYSRLERVEKRLDESDVEDKTELRRKLLKAKLRYISAKEAYKRKDYLKAQQDLEIADLWLREVNSSIITRKAIIVEKIDELKIDAEKELENAEKKIIDTNKTLFSMESEEYDIFIASQILKTARNNFNSAKSYYDRRDYERTISSAIQAQILCDNAIQSVRLRVEPPSQPTIPVWAYPIPLFLILLGAFLYQLFKYPKMEKKIPEPVVPKVIVVERPDEEIILPEPEMREVFEVELPTEKLVEPEPEGLEETEEVPTEKLVEPEPEVLEEIELERLDADKIEEIAAKWMDERGMVEGRLIAWGSKVNEFWFVVAYEGKVHRVTVDKHGKILDWDLRS